MKKFLIAFTTFLSFSTLAATTAPTVPKNLHVYSITSGATYVDLASSGCSGSRYLLEGNHPKYDAIFSLLLAAQLAEKKVQVIFDKCVNSPNNQGRITGVYLK
ncbi:hypothetical protein PRUB_a3596 [Pseudoalteromonas rubra]|uniref:Uncharacterized protein n=1 Tax=Pseudoalteromonas rubra TaxID=43658 RepID=A0A8T0C307_9GAMM|nr:hypothetical protein [Pseudoalteromonas rubra]KAF7783749.1 hypothetical protein PRUB_a3596 [Pseudoalteromonas rubra]